VVVVKLLSLFYSDNEKTEGKSSPSQSCSEEKDAEAVKAEREAKRLAKAAAKQAAKNKEKADNHNSTSETAITKNPKGNFT